MNILKNIVRDEQGATAIEYGLIAALIAVAAMGAMSTLGGQLSTTFGDVSAKMGENNAEGGEGEAEAPAEGG